jgi:hypothetical protein
LTVFSTGFYGGIMLASYQKSLAAASVLTFFLAFGLSLFGQSAGNSGTISGTVLDPTGAVVAKRHRRNPQLPSAAIARSTTTDSRRKLHPSRTCLSIPIT